MKYLLVTIMGILILGTSVMAASDLMKACKIETRKFHCKTKTDAQIQECLDKNVRERKFDGFSKNCYNAHETNKLKMEKDEEKEDKEKETKEKD